MEVDKSEVLFILIIVRWSKISNPHILNRMSLLEAPKKNRRKKKSHGVESINKNVVFVKKKHAVIKTILRV